MKIDLNEMTPFTRQEKFMYAIAERLEKLINDEPIDNPILETVKEQPKKKTTKKKTTKKKEVDKKDE